MLKIASKSFVVEDISKTPCSFDISGSLRFPSQCEIAWSARVSESLTEPLDNSTNKSTGYYNVKPVIKARFPVKRAFNYKRPVYIGNKAKYAIYALEGGKIQNFVQGRLAQIIRDNMKEKKGKLFLAKDISSGFGTSKDGVQYGEFNLKDPSTYTRWL